MPALFGASIEGVEAILATAAFDDDTEPSRDQVAGFVESMSAIVALRLGDLSLYTDARYDQVAAAAKVVIELAAASLADKAGHPEQSGNNSTGNVLWDQYRKSLEDLLEAVGRERDAGAGGDGNIVGMPAHSSPRPLMRRNRGF